ncbi:MAG: CDP-alcohol phosphatidyltransferase family protein [Alphaproteobacteria bacterium]
MAAELALAVAAGLGIAVILAAIGHLPAGLGMAGAWCVIVAGVAVAARRWRVGSRFHAADRITLVRGFATSLAAAAAVVAPDLSERLLWSLAAVAGLALILDGVDGFVARRSGCATEFGARIDREIDAFTVLVLAVLVWRLGRAEAWVLAAGGMRYAFVAAAAVWPWLAAPLPPSGRRRAVCALQIGALVACLPPLLPSVFAEAVLAASVAVLGWSFLVDTLLLRRMAAAGPAIGAGFPAEAADDDAAAAQKPRD